MINIFKTMKKILLTNLLLLLSFVSVQANPQLPTKCQAFRPKVLNEKILKESDAERLINSKNYMQSEANTQTYWYAYSDRANNTTYSDPSVSSQKFKSLSFNQQVIIAKIENGFALVYEDPKIGQSKYPLISEVAESYGWVPMSHLLLWESCLANDKGIYNKALLCVNLDNSSASTKSFGRGYLDPKDKSGGIVLKTDMNFYFIMKREGEMALLSTQSKVNGGYSNKVLFCWVQQSSFVPWNQRSCLEPTWNHEDVEYFASKGIKAQIYSNNHLSGNAVSSIKYTTKKTEKYDQYQYRMKGESLRFPILDGTNGTIYNMSTFSTIGGQASGTGQNEELSEADILQRQELEKMLNINIAIVIDGTSSMEPYYQSVKDAIKEGCNYFSANDKIKVGVVIYRDYADGDGLCEILPFTDAKRNLEHINQFLDSGGKYGIRSSKNDKTQTEALYYGINEALDKLQFREGQSNIMLVVGDCGNDPNDKKCATREQIISKLAEKKVSLMGFQVQNQNLVSYNSFNNQILYIIRTALAQSYQKLQNGIVLNAIVVKNSNGAAQGYDYLPNSGWQVYLGSHRYADATVNKGKMDPSILSKHLVTAISDFSKTIQSRLDLISNAKDYFSSNGMISQENMDFNKAYIEEVLGKEWAEIINKTNDLVNFRGYTKKKDASGRDFFKPIIFISVEEFDVLLKRLSPVYEAAKVSQTKDRTPYIEALKALLRSLTHDMTEAEMAKMTNADITMMIGGLNESAAALKGYSLDDLSNQTIVPAAEYMRIVNDFARKYDRLEKIRRSKTYKYVKEFNDARYYWIPIEDLP